MLKILLFAIYLALILMVIFIERKRPTEALLWVVIMMFLPYFGTILYLIFGSTVAIKLTALIRTNKLKKQPGYQKLLPVFTVDESILSDEDRQVVRFNKVYNASEITCYEKAKFFINGETHYRQLFHDIEHAKTCIFIEFYTIHHDMIGEQSG